jgi:DNA-binding response OmpR family regulator
MGSSRARILLVDDEWLVRTTLHWSLDLLGYHVVSAFDENDALRALSSFKDGPDVAVIDIRLHGSSGLNLGPLLRRTWPDIKLIYTSGQLLEPIELAALGGAAFLAKPFDIADLDLAITHLVKSAESEKQRTEPVTGTEKATSSACS